MAAGGLTSVSTLLGAVSDALRLDSTVRRAVHAGCNLEKLAQRQLHCSCPCAPYGVWHTL